MKKIYLFAIFLLIAVLTLQFVFSDITSTREEKLRYGLSLYIKNVSIPEEIAPGSTGDINILLENVGDSSLRDVVVRMELNNLDFVPVGVAEKKVRILESSKNVNIDFKITASPDSKAGAYKIPLKLEYTDVVGNRYLENATLGVVIGSKPELTAELKSSEIYKGNSIGKITISLINQGLIEIKLLSVELEQSKNYEILGSKKQYVGNIDPDDFESVDFRLKANTNKKSIVLPLSFEYRDANNKIYEERINVTMPILSAKESGITEKAGWEWIVIVVAVIIGYFVYRKFRKKK